MSMSSDANSFKGPRRRSWAGPARAPRRINAVRCRLGDLSRERIHVPVADGEADVRELSRWVQW